KQARALSCQLPALSFEKEVFASLRLCVEAANSFRVGVDDRINRALADATKGDGIAREHEAVGFGTIQSRRFISRAFECANLAGEADRRRERRARVATHRRYKSRGTQ